MTKYSVLENQPVTEVLPSLNLKIAQILRKHLRENKISLRALSDLLETPITSSQLHYILSGKTALTLDRFQQIATAIQMDPQRVLHEALHAGPEITLPFSEAQEMIICKDALHYKIFVACSEPKSLSDLKELFNKDKEKIESTIQSLLGNNILEKLETGIFRTKHAQNIAALRYSAAFSKILKTIVGELYDSISDIVENNPRLIPYIRNMFLVEYLTPEQLREIKKDTFELRDKIRTFVFQNRSDPDSAKRAKKNLMGIFCLVSPLGRGSFINNPALGMEE